MPDYTNDDLANWAGGGAAGGGGGDQDGAGGEGGGGGDDEQEETAKDPCDLLKALSSQLDDAVGKMKGLTLPDDTEKSFKKQWDDLQEQADELSQAAKDACDEHEETHEAAEDEDDEAAEDEESDDADTGGGGED